MDIEYAGPLAGYQKGVLEFAGKRILVLDSPKLIEPAAGECRIFGTFLLNLLGQEQKQVFPRVDEGCPLVASRRGPAGRPGACLSGRKGLRQITAPKDHHATSRGTYGQTISLHVWPDGI